MRTWLPYPLLSIALLLIWLLLNQSVAPGTFVMGTILATGLGWVTLKLSPALSYPRRILLTLRFGFAVALDIVRSNLAVIAVISIEDDEAGATAISDEDDTSEDDATGASDELAAIAVISIDDDAGAIASEVTAATAGFSELDAGTAASDTALSAGAADELASAAASADDDASAAAAAASDDDAAAASDDDAGGVASAVAGADWAMAGAAIANVAIAPAAMKQRYRDATEVSGTGGPS